MSFMKFQEYLDLQKKLVDKPATKTVADYPGTAPTKPETPTDVSGKKSKEEQYPYSNPGKSTQQKSEKGLGDEGDPKLKYNPDTSTDGVYGKKFELGTPIAEWVKKHKNSSLKSYVENLTKNISTKKCPSDPTQAVKFLSNLCKTNEHLMTMLVIEMKKDKGMSKLVKEMFKHNESYKAMAKLLKEERVFERLNYAMNEEVSPPMDGDEEEEMPQDEMPQDEMNPDEMGDEEGSDDLNLDDDEMSDDEDMDSEEEPDDLDSDMDMDSEEEPEMENDDFSPSDSDEHDEDDTGFKNFKSRMFHNKPHSSPDQSEDYFK